MVIPHRRIIKQFKTWSWLPEQPDSDFKRPNSITLSKYSFLRQNHLAKQILPGDGSERGRYTALRFFCEHLVCSPNITAEKNPRGNSRNFRKLQSFASPSSPPLPISITHTQAFLVVVLNIRPQAVDFFVNLLCTVSMVREAVKKSYRQQSSWTRLGNSYMKKSMFFIA